MVKCRCGADAEQVLLPAALLGVWAEMERARDSAAPLSQGDANEQ